MTQRHKIDVAPITLSYNDNVPMNSFNSPKVRPLDEGQEIGINKWYIRSSIKLNGSRMTTKL